MWASPEDTVEGRSDSDFEPAKGYALVDVEADDREEAHRLIVAALDEVDPDQDVVVGGDVSLSPISRHG